MNENKMITSDFEPVDFSAITHERIKVKPYYYDLGLSPYPTVYGRRIVLQKLLIAMESIPSEYGLLIWDIYRPREVQKKFFEWMRNEIRKAKPGLTDEENFSEAKKFASVPSEIGDSYCPPHLSGGAIDLTLYHREEGNEVDMGTVFDDCTQRAHRDYFEEMKDLDEPSLVIRNNRRILRHAMESAGFTTYQHEWWHYDFGNVFWQTENGNQAVFGPLFDDLEWPLSVLGSAAFK